MIMPTSPAWLLDWFLVNPGFHRTVDGRTKLVCPQSDHHHLFYVSLLNVDSAWVTKCKHCHHALGKAERMPDGELKLLTVRNGSLLGKEAS